MTDTKQGEEDIYASWRTFTDSPGYIYKSASPWSSTEQARLTLQQYLWRERLGWNIHPSVKYANEAEIKVADIATGTCLWLLQVSQELSPSTRLVGSDISLAQSPPASVLPDNVSLRVWNVFEPVPKEWIGYFDLVHVRLLYPGLGAGSTSESKAKASPVEVASKLAEMLKPGGYLQWDEYDLTNRPTSRLLPNDTDDILNATKQLFSGVWLSIGSDQLPWTARLEDVFTEIHLEEIEFDDRPLEPIYSKAWHEHEILFCTQIIDIVAKRDRAKAQSLRDLLEVVQQAKYRGKGYVNMVRPVAAVGRKPVQ